MILHIKQQPLQLTTGKISIFSFIFLFFLARVPFSSQITFSDNSANLCNIWQIIKSSKDNFSTWSLGIWWRFWLFRISLGSWDMNVLHLWINSSIEYWNNQISSSRSWIWVCVLESAIWLMTMWVNEGEVLNSTAGMIVVYRMREWMLGVLEIEWIWMGRWWYSLPVW